jgi:hypothetical protein
MRSNTSSTSVSSISSVISAKSQVRLASRADASTSINQNTPGQPGGRKVTGKKEEEGAKQDTSGSLQELQGLVETMDLVVLTSSTVKI